MKTFSFKLLLFLLFPTFLTGQSPYQINWKADIPILIGGGASLVTGRILSNSLSPVTMEFVASLDPNDVNSFDRPAINKTSSFARSSSDYLLFSSISYPFLLLADKKIRNSIGIVGFLFVETTLLSNGLTTLAKGSFKRTRPFIYNPEIPFEDKVRHNSRLSFYSGHANAVASFSFFTAKVFSDYNPNSNLKPYIWVAAITLPAATAFFRYKAGRHFPTDTIVGYLMGASIGYFVPHFHLKERKNKKIGWIPIMNPQFAGFYFNVKI